MKDGWPRIGNFLLSILRRKGGTMTSFTRMLNFLDVKKSAATPMAPWKGVTRARPRLKNPAHGTAK
jgi:hypothetical protein